MMATGNLRFWFTFLQNMSSEYFLVYLSNTFWAKFLTINYNNI